MIEAIEEFKTLLKEARASLGLTQAQLAEKSGVSTASIQNYEAGKGYPNAANMFKLTNALGLTGQEDSTTGTLNVPDVLVPLSTLTPFYKAMLEIITDMTESTNELRLKVTGLEQIVCGLSCTGGQKKNETCH